MSFSAGRETDGVPNSESISLISPNSWLENKEPKCGTEPQFKTNFGSKDLQNNRIVEVCDNKQNCNNTTDSVTRSAMQTNLESRLDISRNLFLQD